MKSVKAPPNVVYAQLKYMWATGAHADSLSFLRQFSDDVKRDLATEQENSQRPGASKLRSKQLSDLLARCYFKLGYWQACELENWGAVSSVIELPSSSYESNKPNVQEILRCYVYATRHDAGWYKAWHTWALANLSVVNHMDNHSGNRYGDIPPPGLAAHAVQAVEGDIYTCRLSPIILIEA